MARCCRRLRFTRMILGLSERPCASSSDFGSALAARKRLFLCRRIPRSGHHSIGDEAGIGADRVLDRFADLGMVLYIGFCVLPALTDSLAVIGEPRTGFLDDPGLDAEVDQLAAL